MTTVLLVDDEELVRKVVRVVLEAEAFEVLEAEEAGEALRIAWEHRPDIVVCDLMLPGSSGAEVVRSLKSGGSDAKILVLTSLPVEEASDEAASAGADDVMIKPFSALGLLERVRALVG